jgi:hypothetical protein
MFPELMDIRNANYSKDEWKRLLQKYTGSFLEISAMTGGRKNAQAQSTLSASVAFGLAGYSNAKKRMLERGYSKEEVAKMSVAQVLLTDAALDIEMFTQELEKSIHLPFADAERFTGAWEQKMAKQSPTRFGAMITQMAAPAITQVRRAGYRVHAEINLLMAIESLRNHAAVHGEFPDSLDKLDLPVRKNPITDKPFQYSLENGNAVIVFEPDARQVRRYEISINK